MIFLFFLHLVTFRTAMGQEVSPLRMRVPPESVTAAKELIRLNESNPIIMPYGGYALVPMEVEAAPFIVPGMDKDSLFLQVIPKGKTVSGWRVSKDAPGVFKYITIPADPKFDRVLVDGVLEGKQTIVWHAVVNNKSEIIDAKAFQVGEKKPDPPGPNPPGPNPPGPDPGPPIPGAGFRVLIVTETKDLSTLPSAQVQALTAREVRDYLDSHTVKENNQPEYRIFDKDIDLSKASQVWKDAMARPRSSVPWIVVTNGKTGYEGPFPPNTAELMKLLKQYGGP